MAKCTLGSVPGRTSQLRKVSLDPVHYRKGRWFLLAEGLLVALLGGAGFGWSTAHSRVGATGVTMLGLRFTPLLGGILLGFGALAVLAATWRRAAVLFSGAAATAGTTAMIVCMVSAANNASGPMGFSMHDDLLYAALAAYNFGLLMWLSANALEGPAWLSRRSRDSRDLAAARHLR